jgi:hypothetical protein
LLELTRREYRRLIATDPGVEKAIRQVAEHQLGAGFGSMLPEEMDWSAHGDADRPDEPQRRVS